MDPTDPSPAGYSYVLDLDGAYVVDLDGAYVIMLEPVVSTYTLTVRYVHELRSE